MYTFAQVYTPNLKILDLRFGIIRFVLTYIRYIIILGWFWAISKQSVFSMVFISE